MQLWILTKYIFNTKIKDTNTLIDQESVKWIKSDNKEMYNVTEDFCHLHLCI